MIVNKIYLVEPDGSDVSLPRNSQGKLFLRTYIPTYFEVTLDGKVDLKIPVRDIQLDAQDLGIADFTNSRSDPVVKPWQAPNMFRDVTDFHKKYGQPWGGPPHWPESEMRAFRQGFLEEEVQEFSDAVHAGNMADAADALADLVWVALGTAAVYGIPFDSIWAEIVRANMEKVRANPAGDPRSKRNAKFDVVKPEGWRPPDHGPALKRAGYVDEKMGLGDDA